MVLDVSNALKFPGQSFGFSVSGAYEPMCAAGETLRFTGPVSVSGNYVFTGEDILLRGTIKANYVAACGRCLKDVFSELTVSFSEEFARTADEEHPDRYLYSGEKLELDRMAGDLISLNGPMRHLCGEDCRGLCPICGADKNTAQCNCPPPAENGSL